MPALHKMRIGQTGRTVVNPPASKGLPAIVVGRQPLPAPYYVISGITKDSTGNILGSCTVNLFRTLDNAFIDSVVSDATTGAYTFRTPGPAQNYYATAYKAGGTDVTGATANTLVGSGT